MKKQELTEEQYQARYKIRNAGGAGFALGIIFILLGLLIFGLIFLTASADDTALNFFPLGLVVLLNLPVGVALMVIGRRLKKLRGNLRTLLTLQIVFGAICFGLLGLILIIISAIALPSAEVAMESVKQQTKTKASH